jgi:hypothetical protein
LSQAIVCAGWRCLSTGDGVIESFLPPTRDEDVSSFVNEQLGTGQRHTA